MKTSKRLLSILLMLTMLLSMFTVMASASAEPCEGMHSEADVEAGTAKEYPEKDATCKEGATPKYWECLKCHEFFWFEADGKCRTSATAPAATGTPDASKHQLREVAAKDATCKEQGNIAYVICDLCGKMWRDMTLKDQLDVVNTPIDTSKHKLDKVDAKDPTCTEDGYEAYWKCSVCGQLFSDDKGTKKIDTPVKRNKTGHAPMLMAGNAATCTKEGWQPYYVCKTCQKEFKDADCTQEITDPSWKTIPKIQHQLTRTDEKPATCTENGTKAYWTCSVCGMKFSDQEGTKPIQSPETISALGHDLEHVAAKEPTKTATGNIEYWHCKRCDKYFADEACTNEITKAQTVIPKLVEEEEHVLTFSIGKNGKLAYADDGFEITSGRTKALKSDDKALELVATADKNHKVVWQLDNGKKHYEGSTAKITISYKDLNVKSELKVWFEEITTELDLTIKVSGFDKGDIEYKYNGGKVTDLEKREKTWSLDDKDEYVKFWLYPKTGYKAVVQLNDGKKYTYSYNESLTIDYDDLDGEDGTLYVSFVKKSSSDVDDYPTLTFDITGGKHGTVYRGTREYEDGDVISIKKNDKMTFKAKTDKGYVAVWTYKGDTYVGDEYTVKMGANDAKLYVEFMDKDDIRLTELPFRDVSKRDWYYDDVVYVYRKGYMDGMSSTRFGGELNTTRGQIVTILWRLTGEPRATKRNPFTDVSSSQYYYDAISWAYDAGVVDGFDAHTFKPDQNVTREQLAAILYRYAKYMNLSTSGSAYLAKYRDADKIANWAYDAMAWANYRGLINGTSATRIDPKGYATRAQIAAILHRFAVEYGA